MQLIISGSHQTKTTRNNWPQDTNKRRRLTHEQKISNPLHSDSTQTNQSGSKASFHADLNRLDSDFFNKQFMKRYDRQNGRPL